MASRCALVERYPARGEKLQRHTLTCITDQRQQEKGERSLFRLDGGPPELASDHPFTAATARSGRSVMRASTPQSRSRRMSAGSFTVHTFTARPARCAWAMKRRDTIRVGPERSGT